MERKADPHPPPPPERSSNLGRPISSVNGGGRGEANLTSSSSSSSSSLSVSPPDFLRQAHAAFKRHRPLGTMQSNFSRASRVLVPQTESSKSSTSTAATADNANKKFSRAQTHVGSARLLNAGFDQRKGNTATMGTNPPDDASITPPSITGTVTMVRNEQMSPFDLQKGELSVSSSHPTNSIVSVNDDLKKGVDVQMTLDSRMDDMSSYFHSLALTEGEGHFGSQAAITDQDLKRQDLQNREKDLQNMVTSNTAMKVGEASMIERKDGPGDNQHFLDPMRQSMVVGSSCVTTMSVHSGPTFQCTHVPLAGHTSFSTQMPSSAVETSLGGPTHALLEGRETVVKEADGLQQYQRPLQSGEGIRQKGISSNAGKLQSQVPSANIPSSNVAEPSQSNKVEKASRKKKYDPDVFFKVNGKLYQKLGKIGSGGSSEVHKVISSDCTIYALKKIKLKGRDYPTAYGFCQEIEYLNKLKGKRNIIQLIDYEVTDKTLLQEVMNGSMTIKDGRIKDDQYIYMVLEYGEIDLANMLSQKWTAMDKSSWEINENWLRFYWQQMLEAVNTIHEERIVHSDLKPANFLLVRGSLKLIDFGIAKAIMSDTTNIQRDAQVGTLNYMSPEAFMWNEHDESGNTIKCGRPSDIWSLGCILYQMVYGRTPFAEYKTFWAKFKVITDKNHEISFEPVSNPWLVDLMRRCLAWDRSGRWRIPQLLQHPFLVPPVPRELPQPLQDHQPCKFLMERVGVYWNDPEVSRLCSELHEVVAKLERAQKD
ncbi:putative serine/threonine-protein kinase mps1 [Iris pallida]|uniref:Serine/threonine-protein kinase mps1 n=1 Tax=Iris pallida TaxID=29817 RepID=A0AAX6FP62_IRIPA|nr:putative serine/threonine-protein kinase mps1 [Iris pallida]